MRKPGNEKLKIGILINDNYIANWQLKIIEEINNSGFAKIGLVIKNAKKTTATGFYEFATNWEKTILRFHLRADQLILGKGTDYNKRVNFKPALKDINEISVTAMENGFTDYLIREDIEEIKNNKLDVILKFGFRVLSGDILNAAKYGIWSFDPENHRGPIGYTEVVNNRATTSVVLQILGGEVSANKVIHRSEMLTNYLSISKNRNACYWRATTIIPRLLENLYYSGPEFLAGIEIKNPNPDSYCNKNASNTVIVPGVVKNIFYHSLKVGKRVIQKLFYNDHWDIFYKINSGETFFPSLPEYQLLPTPAGRFWADPFVVSKDNRHYVFVEDLPYDSNKGHISVIELDNKGNFVSFKPVLEKSYHLSYPFIFEYEGSHYMIPETGANKTVELYKCETFPNEWKFVMNLMENIVTADVTLFHYNDKWWLFCGIDQTGKNIGMLDELHLFFSDNLFTTNWQAHPLNPICTDTKSARPAGRIFIKNNKIYRPSQDCSGIYGRGLNLNEITKLSDTEFEEAIVKKMIPGRTDHELIGTHTFNADEKITVIDGFKHRRRIFYN